MSMVALPSEVQELCELGEVVSPFCEIVESPMLMSLGVMKKSWTI